MPEREPFAPFLLRRLWSKDAERSQGGRARLVHALRIAYAVVREIVDGRLTLHAASLVYTTILSLVPLIALAFSVLKGFGVHYRFENLLLTVLAPLGQEAPVITERLMSFVDKMEVGVLGTLGLALLFYTAISVVQKIELAFNDIWRVNQTRPWARKFTDYLSVLLIGPVMLFSAFGMAASVLASEPVRYISSLPLLSRLLIDAQRLLPMLLVMAAFTFLYKFLPYTRVTIRAALIGGVVAGLIWGAAGWVFAEFVAGAGSYTAIYSAFAALIVFFIWLDVNWLILLVGSAISFYLQYPEYMPFSSRDPVLSNRGRERLALALMRAIGEAQYAGGPPLTMDDLRSRLRLPKEVMARMLDALSAAGLVAATRNEPARWVAILPYEATDLRQLVGPVRMAGETRGLDADHIPADETILQIETRIEAAIAGALDGIRLKDLVTGLPDAELTPGFEHSDQRAGDVHLRSPEARSPAPAPTVARGRAV